MRILLIFGRYFKNLGGFSKILGVSPGILENSWRILRSSRSVFNDHITVKFVLKLFQIYLKSASNLNGNLNCSKELEHYAS